MLETLSKIETSPHEACMKPEACVTVSLRQFYCLANDRRPNLRTFAYLTRQVSSLFASFPIRVIPLC
jgi:hypothetical protein